MIHAFSIIITIPFITFGACHHPWTKAPICPPHKDTIISNLSTWDGQCLFVVPVTEGFKKILVFHCVHVVNVYGFAVAV
jgi:hypothetical protein